MSARFGVPAASGAPRPPWCVPPAPPAPGRAAHRVRWVELDALGHLNNAAWLDVLVQGAFDVLRDLQWPVERLTAGDAAPWVTGGDIEYLDEVRYGDSLETTTWFGGDSEGLDVHQTATRLADGRPVARANTTWRWAHMRTDAPAPLPGGLAAAVASLRAA
jgi:acyl-CoA thioesterase FadM